MPKQGDIMTLAQLRYLLAIVDAGLNITVAAERVNATQPGLSKQLKQLEDQLALRLFVRRGRNLESLTPAGAEIVERARLIVAEAENIRAFAANQRTNTAGSLHIETTHIQAQFVLPEAVAGLRARFPNVDVTLGFAADADDPGRRANEADLMMFSTDGRLPTGDVAIPLYRWDPVALVQPGHPLLRHSGPITLDALALYPLVTYDSSRTAPLSIAQTFVDAGLSPRFAYTVRDASMIKAAVRSGLGIGLLAEMAADPTIDHDLQIVPLPGLFPRCTAWAVLQRDRVLRDYIVQLLSSLSGLSPLTIQRAARGEMLPERDLQKVPVWADLTTTLSNRLTLRVAA
jgi:DNA-binding transcriptional LysR family regulator